MTPALANLANLADLAWPEVAGRAAAGALLVLPIGSTEQHGPHLPLSTDADIAVALCERLAAARDDVLIAPVLGYGSSGEHAGFAGTLSIGQDALALVVLELCRSAALTFRAVLLVSAHGGNADPVGSAADQLRAEGHDIAVFSPRWEGDPHAGVTETSMMLALRSDAVHLEYAVPGDTRPLRETLPLLRTGGVRAVSPTGVLGDPRGATARDGEVLLASLTAALIADVVAWRPTGVES
jgi:creatinine amidohydrolase